ncbi:MAG: hypothetical protein HKL92_06350 [Candidatus Eremiobacteraeota bacterium]|uniref:Uncharacterized protein n=1 Tax=mine drainage metagenome TaxID=410659 RepID=E6PHI8_9ZZZZ|nr:hypothetical protein [Candidatus Eremiobacteraeota bacterium]NNM92947.1 hypothetical protein [Candidatus Eremiobacteraeota bacterium]
MSLDLLGSAADGMQAQRSALDLYARNIAAAQAAGPRGRYARSVPIFSLLRDSSGARRLRFLGARSEPKRDVNMVTEMVAVLDASRAYAADAALFSIGKRVIERTIAVEQP